MLLLVELVWLLSNTQSMWEQRFSPLQGLRTARVYVFSDLAVTFAL